MQSDWPGLLAPLVERVNPLYQPLVGGFCSGYDGSCYQSEWATDLVFAEPSDLQRLYPRLVSEAMTTLGSAEVLRFLGKAVPVTGGVGTRFAGEVSADLKTRPEGVGLQYRLNHNSVKMYDKAVTAESAVLRVETTIHDESDFRGYRPKEGGPEDELAWRPLRRGVADLPRRGEVSQKCNERYLNALASLDTQQTLLELVEKITQPTTYRNKRGRALRPFEAEDRKRFAAVNRGEFALNGMRNRDLQALYFDTVASSPEEARRRSGWVGRKLRLLRAHGILLKVTGTHRYQVTIEGRKILSALLTAQQTPVNQLVARAA